jgi:hypothetical protein
VMSGIRTVRVATKQQQDKAERDESEFAHDYVRLDEKR